jgi:hypothetical protein
MQSSQHLFFRSALFPIEDGEDAETSPEIYGRALATWLALRLTAAGHTIHGCLAEDFGRLVHVSHPRLRLCAACANGYDYADQWQIFAFAESVGLTSLFASREKQVAADSLMRDVESILRAEPGIRDLRDESDDDV